MICDSRLDWSHVQPLHGDLCVSPIFSVVRVQRVAVYELHTQVTFVNDDGDWETRGHTNAFDEGDVRMITVRNPDGQPITFSIEGDILTITMADRTTRVPLRAFDKLRDATEAELAQFEVIDEGEVIGWPSFSEDLHVPSLIEEFGR